MNTRLDVIGIGNAMVSAKYAMQTALIAKENEDYSESIISEYDI